MQCKSVYETARLALRLAAPSFAPVLADYYLWKRTPPWRGRTGVIGSTSF